MRLTVWLAATIAVGGGCRRSQPERSAVTTGESAFAALQRRGAAAMGVDQYTSSHRFDPLPDGGRIELQRDLDDPAGVDQIRHHLRSIAVAFGAGQFDTPELVHARTVPGTTVMAARRARITYTYHDLPRGGEVRIRTADPSAVRAIHEFLAFQRRDHRVRMDH